MNHTRIERDSLGAVHVPDNAYYGAQTQRAVNNFSISGWTMPDELIRALGFLKAAAAEANVQLKQLDPEIGQAVLAASLEVSQGQHIAHFPVDVFQTGSGTSTHMNANEVIAYLASQRTPTPVHPNDHVNCGQSSNDIIPSATHVGASLLLHQHLLPQMQHLVKTIDHKASQLQHITKTGRTHLMDAMPVRFDQELSGWSSQINQSIHRLTDSAHRLHALAIGGTAVGTGINAHPDFASLACDKLQHHTRIPFRPAPNAFAALSCQDTVVECSGQLKTLAVALMKIANDLRWMNSGPLAGLGEITLPTLQPGSSIMPGKVNPVIPEAVCMVAAQVIGMDTTLTVAGQSGHFQLNVMWPVAAYNLLHSMRLLGHAARSLADQAIQGFVVHTEHVQSTLARNPILITALNPVIGYAQGAAIVKQAYAKRQPIVEAAAEHTGMDRASLSQHLDPTQLTHGGLPGQPHHPRACSEGENDTP